MWFAFVFKIISVSSFLLSPSFCSPGITLEQQLSRWSLWSSHHDGHRAQTSKVMGAQWGTRPLPEHFLTRTGQNKTESYYKRSTHKQWRQKTSSLGLPTPASLPPLELVPGFLSLIMYLLLVLLDFFLAFGCQNPTQFSALPACPQAPT